MYQKWTNNVEKLMKNVPKNSRKSLKIGKNLSKNGKKCGKLIKIDE